MKDSGFGGSSRFLFLTLALPLVMVVVPSRARAKDSGGGGKVIVVDVSRLPKGSYPAGYVDVFRGKVQPKSDELTRIMNQCGGERDANAVKAGIEQVRRSGLDTAAFWAEPRDPELRVNNPCWDGVTVPAFRGWCLRGSILDVGDIPREKLQGLSFCAVTMGGDAVLVTVDFAQAGATQMRFRVRQQPRAVARLLQDDVAKLIHYLKEKSGGEAEKLVGLSAGRLIDSARFAYSPAAVQSVIPIDLENAGLLMLHAFHSGNWHYVQNIGAFPFAGIHLIQSEGEFSEKALSKMSANIVALGRQPRYSVDQETATLDFAEIEEALGFKKEGSMWKFTGVYYSGPAE